MKPYMFTNRAHAGQLLAELLMTYADHDDVIVLGLPRGGVPVAYEVATKLHAPLDVLVVRKLGVPGFPEFAMGAIATGGVRVNLPAVIQELGIPQAELEDEAAVQLKELQRRALAYRGNIGASNIEGKIIILVDDGIATGSTIRAAVLALRRQDPKKIIIAVPVGAPDSCEELRPIVEDLVALMRPRKFRGVSQWYEDFAQTTDAEVTQLLVKAKSLHQEPAPHRD